MAGQYPVRAVRNPYVRVFAAILREKGYLGLFSISSMAVLRTKSPDRSAILRLLAR